MRFFETYLIMTKIFKMHRLLSLKFWMFRLSSIVSCNHIDLSLKKIFVNFQEWIFSILFKHFTRLWWITFSIHSVFIMTWVSKRLRHSDLILTTRVNDIVIEFEFFNIVNAFSLTDSWLIELTHWVSYSSVALFSWAIDRWKKSIELSLFSRRRQWELDWSSSRVSSWHFELEPISSRIAHIFNPIWVELLIFSTWRDSTRLGIGSIRPDPPRIRAWRQEG